MTGPAYYAPSGGLPAQTELMTGRAVFTEAYAVIPKGVMTDIVTSAFPHWEAARAWVLAATALPPSNIAGTALVKLASNSLSALRESSPSQSDAVP